MNSTNAQTIANVGSYIRLALLLFAGPLIKDGWVSNDQIEMVSGAVATLAVVGWVAYKNWKAHQNTVAVAAKAAESVGATDHQVAAVVAQTKAGTL